MISTAALEEDLLMIELPKTVDYTLVIGVDRKHLRQLKMVWPTWARHKPEFLERPMVIFYDQTEVTEWDVRQAVTHPNPLFYAWPPKGVTYNGNRDDKWHHPQRYKMLSGFVHVPALTVDTPYWLKLDTDVVATGQPDWIDPKWFRNTPAIVSHRWAFTKPANQMLLLDEWVEQNRRQLYVLSQHPPLNLVPQEGSERLGHWRIISWCGFFNTTLTRLASDCANATCGSFQLPVPSQDGYLWYVATRLGHEVVRTIMKERGWEWWSTEGNIRKAVDRATCNGV